MVNIKKVEFELIPDADMFIFFEKGTKGGVSYISNRYTKASNKYLKSYGPQKESKLCELQNDYPLAPDKVEGKREMFSNYQIKFADFYKILLGNVKKLVPDFLDEEKYVLHYENLQLYLSLGLKIKKYIVY